MPTYDYKCKECNHVFEEQHSIEARNVPRYSPCPNCGTSDNIIILMGNPLIGDPVRLGVTKPHTAFNERLKEIKKNYAKAGVEIQSKHGN